MSVIARTYGDFGDFERLLSRKNKPKQTQFTSFFELVLIRTTIRNLLVFYACFLKLPTVTCVSVISYEVFFKKELLGFCFSP